MSLYQPQLASFNMTGYDRSHAEGFIRLFGMPLATAGQLTRSLKESRATNGHGNGQAAAAANGHAAGAGHANGVRNGGDERAAAPVSSAPASGASKGPKAKSNVG
jgi:hypothetical protein